MQKALITAARAGDERAVAAVVAEAMPLVYSVVGKALGANPDVDDVVQETMLRVVRGIGGLKEPDRFRAWVIAIAYRQIQDRSRSIRKATALGPLVDDLSDWPDPAGDLVDSTLFRIHLAGERREAFEASRWLSPNDQRVLALWWQEAAGALTRTEVSKRLRLDAPHVAVRVQRVKAQLTLARTLLRAWHASPRCDRLTAAAQHLAGPSDPRWLRRLSRHVRGCARCRAHERDLIPAEHLLSGANLAPALAALAASSGAAGALGGMAAPLLDLFQRTGRSLLAKFLSVGGLATAGAAATVFVTAVHYIPDTGQADRQAAPPAAASPVPSPAATPDTAAPSTAARAAGPAGGFRGVTTASHFVAPGGSDDNPGHAYLCRSCQHSVFRALSLHDNGRTGLQLRDEGTVGNLVVDSDFFRNRDPDQGGETGDGLGIEYGSGAGNVVRGCRLYENSDDGLGLHEFTDPVRIERSWSFGNGVNRWGIEEFYGDGYGFKLGGGEPAPAVDHVITDSAAWDNAGNGFTESSNPGALTVRGNTAFRNADAGFAFERSAALLRDNLALDNGEDAELGRRVDSADNSWNQPGWSVAALLTADPASALAPRSPDGALPRTTFLTNTKDRRIGADMSPGR